MNLLCPACHTPLPADAEAVVTCSNCSAEVDVTRAGTISGRPRFVPEIDRTGTDVGGYRIGSRLGGGGMGTVYRAAAPGAVVAIKFLAPALADNPDVVARFAREIDMLTRLEHPAIVRVLAHGTHDGTPWFAMALVEGSDLRARIAAGALPPAETATVFGRLFGALAHAHERGVVHRDLKPANVLLGADGAQLADFGIARFEAEMLTGPMTRLTETAAVLGTLPYMSPEQRRGGVIDRRSDLFSAGVMLYEAATGVVPQGAFPPPSESNPAYGRAFDRIVMQLLQADPARRPAGAAGVAAALSAALAPRRARPRALALAGAALAVTIAGGTLGARLMFRDHGGKLADKAALEPAVMEARVPAPAAETRAPAEAAKPAAADPASEPADTKALPSETGAEKKRGKTRHRVVLKAVADVKKLRKTATKAEPMRAVESKPKSPTRDDGPTELDKIATGRRGGKPIPAAKAGKKAKALTPEEEFEQVNAEVKEAVPPAARPADSPDGGATRVQPPKRK